MSSAPSVALLLADYTALSKEAGRRHSDAADKASQHLKSSSHELALSLSSSDPDSREPPLAVLYQPIFLASATRNAKVIALAVSALQRLITAGAVPAAIVGRVLETLEQVVGQGVDIQLKILQTLVSLLTTKNHATGHGQPLVQGEQLGRALELSHRLTTSKIPVVASTASATLRQLFMFVYDRIVDEDSLVANVDAKNVPEPTFDVDVPPLERDRAATTQDDDNEGMRSIKLRPAARDAYLLLEDLCLLIAGSVEGGPDGEPSFLRWSTLSRTFGLELVESIVSGFGPVVRTHPELLLVLRAHLCPLLIRFLSSPPGTSHSTSSSSPHAPPPSTSTSSSASTSSPSSSLSSSSSTFSFPLTLRLTRVVFLLLKQFSDLLTLESEVFLTMFVRIIAPAPSSSSEHGGGGEGGHPAGPGHGTSPLWMRVLALEIFRGLCGDFELVTKFYQRYDAAAAGSTDKGNGGGSTVFSDLMTAFNRLATEKPTLIGTGNAVLYGSSMGPLVAPPNHHHLTTTTTGSLSSSNSGSGHSGGMLDSAVELGLGLAHAAGSVVGSGIAAAGAASVAAAAGAHQHLHAAVGLNPATASMKLQCIDQLDKAEPPAIPETYILLLALQCLCALADGFATFTLSTYQAVLAERAHSTGEPIRKAPSSIDWDSVDDDGSTNNSPKWASLAIVKEMAETSWPALLASLSFFVATALSDDLFVDVVAALEGFTCVCGVLDLSTPREAFLTTLCKFAIPPTVVSHIASTQEQHHVSSSSSSSSSTMMAKTTSALTSTTGQLAAAATSATTAVLSAGAESLGLTTTTGGGGVGSVSGAVVGLSSRNLACLRALLGVSNYLAGSLGKTWFSVFEALQNADFVLRATTASRAAKKRSGGGGGGHSGATIATGGGGGGGQPSSSSSKPIVGGPSSSSNASASGGDASTVTEGTKFPAVPTEADEQAIQRGIAALFEVSKSLDDDAFKQFVSALCRLNGEMVGIAMNEDGTPSSRDEDQQPESSNSSATTPEKTRRRSSGISTRTTNKLTDKSFGISKLGVVALFNVQRLVSKDPQLGWDLVTRHLLAVLHHVSIPTVVRLQAADVLDSVLILAPKQLSLMSSSSFGDGDDSDEVERQRAAQTRVLAALASQAEPAARSQSTTDVDIRRMALESLLKILETNGHAFVAGWDTIFHVLRTACPSSSSPPFAPPSPQPSETSRRSLDTIVEGGDHNTNNTKLEPLTPLRLSSSGTSYFPVEPRSSAKTQVLVRTSFPCLQLICSDFLGALGTGDVKDCIGTLAEFGKQTDDVNIALTAGGLLWSVSDHVQAERRRTRARRERREQVDDDGDDGNGEARTEQDEHEMLWMFLLDQLLSLCDDPRQEVRDAAMTSIFRSISMYGTTLSNETWHTCCHDVIFALVDHVTSAIADNVERRRDCDAVGATTDTVPQAFGPPIRLVDKQWDDSKTLVLRSMGDVFFDYLGQLVKTDRFEDTWRVFVGHLGASFVNDRATPATAAMRALEKVLTVSLESTEAERITSSWRVAWETWVGIGDAIQENASLCPVDKVFTQANLEAFVRAVLPLYTPPYVSFDLEQVSRLLGILRTVLTYHRSPDYRSDIDGLLPLQSAVLEVIAVIKLDEVPGAASAVLSDLSDYLALAYRAPFDVVDDNRGRAPKPPQRVTFIALTKEVMPHVLWLHEKYRDDASIYEQGAVEKMLAAYSIPMRLKHACPAPAKFASAEPLWKTATVDFLKAVRQIVKALASIGPDLPVERCVGVWRAIVEGFEGALLAETGAAWHDSIEDLHEEENFDLSLLISLEQDILPFVGNRIVPDALVRKIGKTLQLASTLYALESRRSTASLGPPPPRRRHNDDDTDKAYDLATTPPPTPPPVEPRFDFDFDRQAAGQVKGTTVEVVEVGRERFAYWSLDLLFAICSDQDKGDELEHRRIATLCLPSLQNRCAAILKTYIADAPLRGKIPFPRVRQEELVYILDKLNSLRLRKGTLWASSQPDPTNASTSWASSASTTTTTTTTIRSILLASRVAHLYELHAVLTALLRVAQTTPRIRLDHRPPPPHHYVAAESSRQQEPQRRGAEEEEAYKGLPDGFDVNRIARLRPVRVVGGVVGQQGNNNTNDRGGGGSRDVFELALSCLETVGCEIGSTQLF